MQRRTLLKALAAGGVLPLAAGAAAPAATPTPWRDVLDTPAQKSPLAARGLLTGLARAGKRIVAVGQRGHVLLSDDAGKSWQQADVPVSADLVAVYFPNAETGWAVGHDGVVLKSADAGRTWTRQLDGRGLGDVLVAHYTAQRRRQVARRSQALRGAGRREPVPRRLVRRCKQRLRRRRLRPGAAHRRRRQELGAAAARHRQPQGLHLYAVRRIGGELFIAGEQGLLLKLDRDSGRFVALTLPYQGTLFGLVGKERAVLAHGLRGNVVRSTDGGRSLAERAHRRRRRPDRQHARRARPHRHRQPGRARARQRRRRRELRAAEDRAADPGRRRGERRRRRTGAGRPAWRADLAAGLTERITTMHAGHRLRRSRRDAGAVRPGRAARCSSARCSTTARR